LVSIPLSWAAAAVASPAASSVLFTIVAAPAVAPAITALNTFFALLRMPGDELGRLEPERFTLEAAFPVPCFFDAFLLDD
jgi:hypothetical protein